MDTRQAGVWKAKRGNIPMTNMDNDYLQTALESCERRYTKHVTQSLDHADTSNMFLDKMKELLDEASSRGITLKSLTEKEPGMHKFVESARKVEKIH